MRIHPAGKEPLAIVALILGIAALVGIISIPFEYFELIWLWLLALAVPGIWALSFFRYPKRSIVNPDPSSIYSAADGKVVVVEKISSSQFPEGQAWQISVFMSIYSVHINYAPISGTITSVNHRKGLHLMAIKPKASLENEQAETIIQRPDGQIILVRQIAGAAARRVLTFLQVDDTIVAGNELGFIRFGSRVDHIIPITASINVQPGDKVKGCQSILATLDTKPA